MIYRKTTVLETLFDIVNFVWKTNEGEGGGQKEFFCYFLFFGIALIIGGCEVVDSDRKSYLGSAEYAFSSSRDFSQCNKHESFWFVVSNGYFHILFL